MSNTNQEADNKFAKTDKEAEDRYKLWKSKDPFPKIQPALLNSADIYDYVKITGMLCPFYPEKLKSASYEVALMGKVIYWDESGNKRSEYICEGKKFKLIKNSIAFVTPEPTFLLPDYIAIRFNLKITHVHRGILLGTGPLVDPGYQGDLLIPLHNLTNNDYTFKGGEGFIWVEFTKISVYQDWLKRDDEDDHERSGEYIPFPPRKIKQDPEVHLSKALKDQEADSIRSSIPDVIQRSKEMANQAADSAIGAAGSATEAKDEAKSMRFQITWGGIIGLAVLFIALAALTINTYMLIQDSTNYMTSISDEFNEQQIKLTDQLVTFEKRLEFIERTINGYQDDRESNKTESNSTNKSLPASLPATPLKNENPNKPTTPN